MQEGEKEPALCLIILSLDIVLIMIFNYHFEIFKIKSMIGF